MLLHDLVSAVLSFPYLRIDAFRYIWITEATVFYQSYDCFWILLVIFLRAIVIQFFRPVYTEWIYQRKPDPVFLQVMLKCEPVASGWLASNKEFFLPAFLLHLHCPGKKSFKTLSAVLELERPSGDFDSSPITRPGKMSILSNIRSNEQHVFSHLIQLLILCRIHLRPPST